MHIRDEDCDVETLQEPDFEETEFPDPSTFGTQARIHVLYAIQSARLAVLCKSSTSGAHPVAKFSLIS
jgi:hypothetical protein